MESHSCKRPWRKLVKKLQRKRRRTKIAQLRDKELESDELEKLKDPLYKSWLEQQEEIEQQRQHAEEIGRQEQEELWLRRELLAQNQFKKNELKRLAEEAKLEAERQKQEEKLRILEEARHKKRNEIKLQAERAAKEFDDIMSSMQEYLEDITMKTPPRLNHFVQSRLGEKSCDFFDKTNCCRFGVGCTFNHNRPMIAKIILIKNFFQHPLLDQQEHEEYSRSDSELELSEEDLRESYDEFCKDVWPVLEEFGSIVNFRAVRNIQAHLRGHVFVEYKDKRSALKAFINLQNRYYAAKRLNVEFSNIRQWRTAVCGLSLGRKCPKGMKCNFLHLMKNMNNKYNEPIDSAERSARSSCKSSILVPATPSMSWNSEANLNNKNLHSRNWRWSESPEIDIRIKKNEENIMNKTNDSSSCSWGFKKSCLRRLNSDSPEFRNNKKRKTRSTSKSPRRHKKRTRSPALEQEKISKTSRKFKDKNKESDSSKQPRQKHSHRRSSSSSSHRHKYVKRSRSKSPLNKRKERSHKKSSRKRHHHTSKKSE